MQRIETKRSPRDAYTLAIASGKGGVGKTNTASNMAIQLASLGQRVLLFDADLGLANVDSLLGLLPRYTLQHLLKGDCTPAEVLMRGPSGIYILPAASGASELADLQAAQADQLAALLNHFKHDFDVILIDTASGIAPNMQRMVALADEVLLITTPEPTSVIDAYAVTKILSRQRPETPLKLMVNMISEHDTGERVAAGFHDVVARFLDRRIETVAQMPFDSHVQLAVRRQQPFALCYPECPASRSLRALSLRLLGRFVPAANRALASQGTNRISAWLEGRSTGFGARGSGFVE